MNEKNLIYSFRITFEDKPFPHSQYMVHRDGRPLSIPPCFLAILKFRFLSFSGVKI